MVYTGGSQAVANLHEGEKLLVLTLNTACHLQAYTKSTRSVCVATLCGHNVTMQANNRTLRQYNENMATFGCA